VIERLFNEVKRRRHKMAAALRNENSCGRVSDPPLCRGAQSALPSAPGTSQVSPARTFTQNLTHYPAEGSIITLDGSGSSDPDGDPLVFKWDFQGQIFFGAITDISLEDDFNGTATLTVYDRRGGVDTATVDVVFMNEPPSVDVGPDVELVGESTLSRQGAFTDPGADTWIATVDYGDGSGERALPLSPDKTFLLAHSYSACGAYTVTVIVEDDDGGVGEDSLTVSVALAHPTASPTPQEHALRVHDPVAWHDPQCAGWRERYTLSFTNQGTAALTNVRVSCAIPAWSDVLIDECSPGARMERGHVRWDIGSVAPGETITLYLEIRPWSSTAEGTVMSMCMTVSCDQLLQHSACTDVEIVRCSVPSATPTGMPTSTYVPTPMATSTATVTETPTPPEVRSRQCLPLLMKSARATQAPFRR